MYGFSLVLNGLKWWGIYSVGEKLAVSSHSAQNLSNLVDRSILSIDCIELAITVQFDRSNGSKFDHWHIQSTTFINQSW